MISEKEEKKILERLYDLEKVEIKNYTREDNFFIYKCLHCDNKLIVQTAQNAVSRSMWNFIYIEANKLYERIGPVGGLSPQSVEEIHAAGMATFAERLMMYDPTYETQIHTYATSWIMKAMMVKRNDEIRSASLPEGLVRAIEFVSVNEHLFKEQGIDNPSAQDYYQLALEKGKNTSKIYNLTNLSNAIELRNGYTKQSLEELEENGITINNDIDVHDEVIQRESVNNIYGTVDKLPYFEQMAIKSRIEAQEEVKRNEKKKNDARTIYVTAYKIFKKITDLPDVSQRDFSRLLTDATNELSERLEIKSKRMVRTHIIDNSLDLDESFDTLFGDEMEYNEQKIDKILEQEMAQKYNLS